ncbi:MAG: hypothetical protein R2828_12130 [Saprospiraceae bacterium]
MNPNLVLGAGQSTLNTLLSELFAAVKPEINTKISSILNKENEKLHAYGIASLALVIEEAPIIDLIAGDGNTAGTLELQMNAQLGIHFTQGGTANVDITLKVGIKMAIETASGQALLNFQVTSLSIQTNNPSNPTIDEILNNAIIPSQWSRISPMRSFPIPPKAISKLHDFHLSLPAIAIQAPNFVAYFSTVGTSIPPIPSPTTWPSNGLFSEIPVTFLQQTLNNQIGLPIGPHTSPSTTILHFKIGGDLRAQINPISQVEIEAGGGITATASVIADAELKIKTPHIPIVGSKTFSVGPKATGNITFTLKPTIDDNKVKIEIVDITIPDFSFSIDGLPDLLKPIEHLLFRWLNDLIKPLLEEALKALPLFKVKTLHPHFKILNQDIDILIQQLSTSAKDTSLLVDAQLSFAKATELIPANLS